MGCKEIKVSIIRSGTTITEIARDIGVSREWVSRVVNGHSASGRIREGIALAVGKGVKELWPNNKSAAQG